MRTLHIWCEGWTGVLLGAVDIVKPQCVVFLLLSVLNVDYLSCGCGRFEGLKGASVCKLISNGIFFLHHELHFLQCVLVMSKAHIVKSLFLY